MARIRTIKPEFWTDEKLTECSLSARLFFLGLLNFADDNGNLVNSPKRLKMQIFPADNVDTEVLIQELTTHGVLTEYSVNEKKYLNIKGFKEHQRINRPSQTTIPLMECSRSTHGGLTDGKERKGKEKKNIKKKISNPKISLAEWEEKNGRFCKSHCNGFFDRHGLSESQAEVLTNQFRLKCEAQGYKYADFPKAFQSWSWDDQIERLKQSGIDPQVRKNRMPSPAGG